ncbi:extradiol dioxygenase [Mycobacterium deserti]|uniref:Extradiol dioxygenase n=1 Tax=Mycobacterium deserti TaxID=2978347 RepID=A0ABT2MBI9_9MYCO|nr:extradiol dioxygenase [Mycobacterium deserti]MCT7659629.1 extradiol dioxygenase [Mycobacterium deserti]
MLGHLGINVPDLSSARGYYDAIMPLLGFEIFLDAGDEFAYRPSGGKPGTYLFFYPSAEASDYSRDRTGLQHLAFMVRTRSAVTAVHELVIRLADRFGGQVLHEPRVFPQYPQPYFATFWLDPFGVMLEAVCHHDRD